MMLHVPSPKPISIPAPARGRTGAQGPAGAPGKISIPAPARGRTFKANQPRRMLLFQFPPPRGGEPGLKICVSWSTRIFPPPRGGEPGLHAVFCGLAVLIPAPARGRTGSWPGSGPAVPRRPYSRPREGANRVMARIWACGATPSLFPPPRGGDPRQIWYSLHLPPSLFPPPRGGEPGESYFFYEIKRFVLIPAPARGRTGSKTAQNRAVYLVSLLKFGRISAILPYILSATRAKKRETPKIIGFLLRRPTGRSCMEQVGAGGVR